MVLKMRGDSWTPWKPKTPESNKSVIPMLLQRLDNQAPSQHPDLPERPSVTARRFHYDTVGHGSQAALLCAWKAFGADHLVAGSDYPVLLAFETYRQTFHYIRESGLPAEDIDKILNHNAQILLGLDHGVGPCA